MPRKLTSAIVRCLKDRSGNVIITAALALPVVLGAFGLGAEGASWFATKRALQNAADAAAIAAATNAGPTYDVEAKGVAAQYGQTDGKDGVTVTASNAVPCPTGVSASTCYGVTVSRPMPLMLAQVVGYGGNAKLNGAPAQLVSATAVAIEGPTTRSYCILALASDQSPTALLTHGAPNANLSGCNVMSNTGATCTGHNTGADVGDAHTTNNGCGVVQHSGVSTAPDPYADLAKNIPKDPCKSRNAANPYPQEPVKKNAPALPATNQISGSVSWSGVTQLCGDVKMTGNVTVANGTTLVIYNGQLDTNGYTLTGPADGMTIVFAGDNGSYTHTTTGGGTLDYAAPGADSTSVWKGIAMYQSPTASNGSALKTGVDMSAAGNSPTWDISGAVYMPWSNVTLSGAVNKSSNGQSCFTMVVNTLTVNGTANILAHGQCEKAGVTQPTAKVPGRGQLVS